MTNFLVRFEIMSFDLLRLIPDPQFMLYTELEEFRDSLYIDHTISLIFIEIFSSTFCKLI
jgi:hypothetical protein